MSTITTEFEMTLEREDGDIIATIAADGDIGYADPSVGIMGDGIDYVTITSAEGDNGPITLTATESEQAERKAHDLLCDKLGEPDYGDC